MPFGLWISPEQVEQGEAFFYGTVNSAGQEISFWIEGGGGDALKRLIGCAILGIMPEEGIDEALTSLKDILDFRTSYRMLPGAVESRQTTGRIVSTSQRPDLVIPE